MVYLICGQKGTGKTLFTTSFLQKHKRRYKYFFSNFPISFCYKLDSTSWVNFKFPEHSAILIDEAQLYFNSRKFSELTKSGVGMQLLDFLTMCRHYKVDIFFITQSANRIDLQIRELSDYVFYLKRTFKFFNRPILTYGLQFIDIMEFEKYMNPNNFSNDFRCSFLFKFIMWKDLKSYDTFYIDKSYIEKEKIPILMWGSPAQESGGPHKRHFFINLMKQLYFKIKKFIFYFLSRIKKNKENEFKYF